MKLKLVGILTIPIFLLVILIVIVFMIFGGNEKSNVMDLDCANNLEISGNQVSKDTEKNAQIIWNYLINQGWAKAAVAGVLGNLQQESNINPTSTNSSSGAHGIAQWLGERLSNEKSFATEHSKDPDSIQAQVMFLYEEANGTEKSNLGDYAKNSTNPSIAAVQWELRFERAGKNEANNIVRASNAEYWYNKFKDSTGDNSNSNTVEITETDQTCDKNAGETLNVSGPTDKWWTDLSAWANKWANKTPNNYLLGGNPSNLDNSATAKAVHGATDCSGFTYWAFNKIGITLTRTSQTQWSQDVDEVKKEDAKAGDLVFFYSSVNDDAGSGYSHVGIYIGNGQMIDEENSGIKKTNVWQANNPAYGNWSKVSYGRIKANLLPDKYK
ncbi:C40 family peptidase [Liquorilactobacillus satsumensis]|uniref:phage tail tip lysozyme n=1 Tax=Liquorilactobacillus satsumensis TaxID=259059 RepID=UPI0021C2A23D|nr:phage tail tip lysozyme [Liquorilactobacillus satsumensis]MCP9356713.1 C40 family peptidase [Liquorilactobacillus satsumensis]MCP9370653.1 C40 family peptidase [Liquorilactobacillus satsumensis]